MSRLEQFSVTQFFPNKDYETVRFGVSQEEAIAAFARYTDNVSARLGLTVRVIITDGGDCICMEWQHGKGIVFPPPQKD